MIYMLISHIKYMDSEENLLIGTSKLIITHELVFSHDSDDNYIQRKINHYIEQGFELSEKFINDSGCTTVKLSLTEIS